MNIPPISSIQNKSFPVINNNDAIKALEKQKENLQEQLQKTKDSKMDDKMKQDKVKQLQEQIQQIDFEIKQKQAEKLNQNKEAQQQPENTKDTVKASNETDTGSSLAGMTDLLQANSTFSTAKKMNNTKNNMHNRGEILKIEIKLDESRSKSGNTATSKRKELHNIELREKDLDKKVAETSQEVQEHVKKATKAKDKAQNNQNDGKVEKNDIDNISSTSDMSNTESTQNSGDQQEDLKQKTLHKYRKIDIKV